MEQGGRIFAGNQKERRIKAVWAPGCLDNFGAMWYNS
jgi:hypothetical protein